MVAHQDGKEKFHDWFSLESLVIKNIIEYDSLISRMKRIFNPRPDPLASFIKSLLKTKCRNTFEHFDRLQAYEGKVKNLGSRTLKILREMEKDIKNLEPNDTNYSIIVLKELFSIMCNYSIDNENFLCFSRENDTVRDCEKFMEILLSKIKEIKKNYEEKKMKDLKKLDILAEYYFRDDMEGFSTKLRKWPFCALLQDSESDIPDYYVHDEITRRITEEFPWKSGKNKNAIKMLDEYLHSYKLSFLKELKTLVQWGHLDLQEEEIEKIFKNTFGHE